MERRPAGLRVLVRRRLDQDVFAERPHGGQGRGRVLEMVQDVHRQDDVEVLARADVEQVLHGERPHDAEHVVAVVGLERRAQGRVRVDGQDDRRVVLGDAEREVPEVRAEIEDRDGPVVQIQHGAEELVALGAGAVACLHVFGRDAEGLVGRHYSCSSLRTVMGSASLKPSGPGAEPMRVGPKNCTCS